MNISILYILISLLFLALFSGSEAAFQYSGKLFYERDRKNSRIFTFILHLFQRNSEQFLATLLLGSSISLVVYVLSVTHLFGPVLNDLVSSRFLIFLLLLTVSVVVVFLFGDYLPKILAGISPNTTLVILSAPLIILYLIFYPLTKVMTFISWAILRLFGITISFEKKNVILGRDELDSFIQKSIEEAPENTELDKEARLFRNALDFSQVRLRDCIVPRTEIVALDLAVTIDDLRALFIETGLSKILIYKEDIDNIIGYIHSSEMFTKPADWRQKINPLPMVPENMSANKLMKNLLSEKKSMAVVVDEFGGTAGIITLEDLVEEILGEIEDEHDTKSHVAKKLSDNEFVLSGRVNIDTVNEMFGLDLPESDEYMTISGYILDKHQNFPKLNEIITIDCYTFKIIRMTATKIELVKLKVDK